MSLTSSRFAASLLASTALTFGGFGLLSSGVASATPVHTGCGATSNGISSGWCNLYPGNASGNAKYLGQILLTNDATLLTIQTQSASDGSIPRTSFACLTLVDSATINHRLQAEQCTNKFNGVWVTWTGSSVTIDVTQYPQFANMLYTVQVAANGSAGNGNGDAFYNSFAAYGYIGH